MPTYSFLDVQATIVGPGGAFSLGSGAGVADGGIAISMTGDKNKVIVGADGRGMHSLLPGKSGTVTVSLLKTSPVNAKLSTMYALQTASSAAHGLNTIIISNPVSGDSITCLECAFRKMPNIAYGSEVGTVDWVFDAITIDISLGGGLAANLASTAVGLM